MQFIATVVLLYVAVSQALKLNSPEDWDHFIFAQTWPPGTCADAEKKHHSCHVPTQVNSWIIHGLWPSNGSSKGPLNCNSSLPFDFSQIEYLLPNLTAQWPNLFTDTSLEHFWEHEWVKHGTCCLDVPTVSGEKNFFTAALTLNKKFDILRMLQDSGIVPGTEQYDYSDFINAVTKAIGFQPVIQCTVYQMDNGTEYHMISQISICLSKDLQPESCDFTASNSPLKFIPKFTGQISSYHNKKYGDGQSTGFDSVLVHQSICSRTDKFNYPPIQHN